MTKGKITFAVIVSVLLIIIIAQFYQKDKLKDENGQLKRQARSIESIEDKTKIKDADIIFFTNKEFPAAAEENIEIFVSHLPSKPYIEIAFIDAPNVNSLLAAAAKIGADALISMSYFGLNTANIKIETVVGWVNYLGSIVNFNIDKAIAVKYLPIKSGYIIRKDIAVKNEKSVDDN